VGKLKLSLMLLLMFLFCMLVLLVAFRPVAHANPAIFSDGFESGDFSAWTGTSIPTGSTVETVTSPVHQGSYAAHIVRPLDLDVHPNIYKDFSTVSTAYARFYVRFGSLPSSNGAIYYPAYFGMSEYPTYVTEISAYNNDGTVYWRIGMPDDDANWYFSVSSSTVSVDTWYCVEIKKVGASSVGESRLYVDGVEVASVTGKNTGTKGQCNELSFWADSSGAGLPQIDTYFDSVIIDSSYIGPQYQVSFSQTGLTSDAGSNTVLTVGTTNYTYANLPVNNIWVDSGTTFSWSTVISGGAGKQFVETGDSGLTSPITGSGTSSATYKTQYYLTVTSDYGVVSGQGWYDNGLTANAGVSIGSIDHLNGTQHVFVNWGGDASGTGYALSNAITMDGPKTASAVWKTQYELTMAANLGSTSPSVGGGHWYDAGSLVTISATAPSAGAGERYVWVGWTGTGVDGNTTVLNPAEVTMNSPVIEAASWTHQYYLTFDQSGVGSDFTGTVMTVGGVDYNRDGHSDWYDSGASIAYSYASPLTVDAGKRYFKTSTDASPLVVSGTTTVTGSYMTQWYINVTSVHDSPTASGWVDSGGSFPASVTSPADVVANDHQWVCTGYRLDGGSLTAGTSYTFTSVASAHTIEFDWGEQFYLTVSSLYDTPSGAGWYDSGSTAYATLTDGTVSGGAGTRYVFTSWGTDASGTSYAQSDAITMDGPKTALANWKTQYELTMAANLGSTAPSVGGGHWYDAGSTVTIDATAPSAGAGERYVWNGWTGSGTGSYTGTDNPATLLVTMNGPITESASWTHQYYLTVENGGHGTSGGEGWYDADTNAQATITPLTVAGTTGTQYVFAGWSGAATGSGSPSDNILMAGPKTATATWTTQYNVTFAVSGLDGTATGTVLVTNGSSTVTFLTFTDLPYSVWVNSSDKVSYDYQVIVLSTVSGQRFRYNSATGPAAPITVTGPVTVTGNYGFQYHVTFAQSGVGSDFTGTVMTVGGTDYSRDGHSDWYDSGASVSFSFYSPLSVDSGKQYVFLSANETSPLTISRVETVTGTYQTQYYVPLSGWQEDPEYTNASYVLTSTPSSLYLELEATDTSSKVAIFNLNAPKLSLSGYAYVSARVAGTNNAKILLRFFLDDGSGFDVVYWQNPATLNATRFYLAPYAGRTLSGLVYVALISSDGSAANINITQISFQAQDLQPLVPLSGWEEDPQYTNATYVLTSSASSLYLELAATDTSSKVAIFSLDVSRLSLSNYTYVNATVTGSTNARILLRFFLDDGSAFDVVYWQNPATLNATRFYLAPYAGRTLSGLVYVALMSSDGTPANINITQIAFATQTLSPSVPLSGWQEDPQYTNATYVLTSSASSLYLELDAADTNSKVAIFSLDVSRLSLSGYTYVNATVTGSTNARILLRFFLDDGSAFDVVWWQDPVALNATTFDLIPYAGRTLTGLVYVGLMSSDGTAANITITQIAFTHA